MLWLWKTVVEFSERGKEACSGAVSGIATLNFRAGALLVVSHTHTRHTF